MYPFHKMSIPVIFLVLLDMSLDSSNDSILPNNVSFLQTSGDDEIVLEGEGEGMEVVGDAPEEVQGSGQSDEVCIHHSIKAPVCQ